jgi:hypothetical protein
VFASVDEVDNRTGDEICDRSGHQHFAGARSRCDSCPDVHRYTSDVVAAGFDFPSVESSANLYS